MNNTTKPLTTYQPTAVFCVINEYEYQIKRILRNGGLLTAEDARSHLLYYIFSDAIPLDTPEQRIADVTGRVWYQANMQAKFIETVVAVEKLKAIALVIRDVVVRSMNFEAAIWAYTMVDLRKDVVDKLAFLRDNEPSTDEEGF